LTKGKRKQRTVTHRTGDEPLDQIMPRLNLLQRNRLRLLIVELEKTAERNGLDLLLSVLRVLVETFLVLLPDGVLEGGDTGRVVDVRFAAEAPVVLSELAETRRNDNVARWVAPLVKLESVEGEHLEVAAADAGGGTGKATVDDGLVLETEDLEDLGT
jgi:hypothetical protein